MLEALLGGALATAVLGYIVDRILYRRGRNKWAQVIGRFEEFLTDWNGTDERRTPDGRVILAQRQPGVPERLLKIEEQLNGGGLGTKMNILDAKLTDHLDSADLIQTKITEDIREVRRDLGHAVVTLTTQVQRVEEDVASVKGTILAENAEVKDANQHLRAALTEALATPTDEQ